MRQETRDAVIVTLDAYVDTGAFPNLRGSMTRVPGSRYYRLPPKGCPADEPTTATLVCWLDQARLEFRAKRASV